MSENKGYIYSRIWHVRCEKFLFLESDNSVQMEWLRHWENEWLLFFHDEHMAYHEYLKNVDLLDMKYKEPLNYFCVTVGQTERDLARRYANSKAPFPLKEWNVLVDSPRKHEDKLRSSFKSFLSSKLYQISKDKFEGCLVQSYGWYTRWVDLLNKRSGHDVNTLSVFSGTK